MTDFQTQVALACQTRAVDDLSQWRNRLRGRGQPPRQRADVLIPPAGRPELPCVRAHTRKLRCIRWPRGRLHQVRHLRLRRCSRRRDILGSCPRIGCGRRQHHGESLGGTGWMGRAEPVVSAGVRGEDRQESPALRLSAMGPLDDEVQRLVTLGARVVSPGHDLVVMVDPEGNEFCVEP